MQPVKPSSTATFLADDVKQREDYQDSPITRTFQTATPPSGFWRWISSVASYFSSRSVTHAVESPAIVIKAKADLETPEQQELHRQREEWEARRNENQRQLEEMQARFAFPPYNLVIEFPQGNEETYAIQNPADEIRVIQELEQWVNQNFQSVKINGGIWSEDMCQRLQGQYARVRTVFANRFNLHQEEESVRECLGPKPVVEEALGDHLKQIRYANGIEEIRRFSQGKWQTEVRNYPNGEFEKGNFDQAGVLCRGVRFSKGEYEFFGPERLGHNEILFFGKFYVFAFVEINEKRQLALLEKDGGSYRLFKQPPLPVLFNQTMSTFSSLIKEVIDCLVAPISPGEIVKYAFEIGHDGEPRIFSLQQNDVLSILRQAQKLQIPFNFHASSPKTNQTLFEKWVVKGGAELIRCMLDMDPTCIDQTKAQQTSFVRQILNSGWGEERVVLLKEAMKARNIPLSENDLWVDRIYQGDSSFKDEEFLDLDPTLQKELYLTAHACSHIELVDRMNRLGMKQHPIPPRGPTPLSVNMDLVEQRKAVESCLLELRAEKRFLLPDEAPHNLKSFHNNQDDFSRVLGAAFVKKTVQRLGLKHIDAAETFAVLKSDIPSIHINTEHGTFIQSADMDIYAEKIVEVDRFVSLEEAHELLDAIEATGFTDIHRGNFMVTKDKIYFIDLEWGNFQKHADYGFMGRLLSLVRPEDQDTLLANINARIEAHQKNMEEHEVSLKATQHFEEESRKTFFCGRGLYEFPIASIMK